MPGTLPGGYVAAVLRTGALFLAAALAAPVASAQQALHPSNGSGNWYGQGMASGDGFVAIGAGGQSVSGGLVDVYRRGANGWQLDATVRPADVRPFGSRVALGGGWLAAANTELTGGGQRRAIDLFRRGDDGWSFTQRLALPADLPAGSYSVGNLVVSADVLVATAVLIGVEGETSGVRTYTFNFADGHWGAAQLLAPPVPTAFFGEGLALADGLLAVSSAQAGGSGRVALYRRSGTDWTLADTLLSPQPQQLDFGAEVALCGRYLAVLARTLPGLPPPLRNRVFVFAHDGSQWVPDGAALQPATPPPNPQQDIFGSNLACSESVLAMRGAVTGTTASVSLAGDRQLQLHSVALPSYSPGDSIAVFGGDVLVADPYGPNGSSGSMPGVVFAFADAVDSIFLNGFD